MAYRDIVLADSPYLYFEYTGSNAATNSGSKTGITTTPANITWNTAAKIGVAPIFNGTSSVIKYALGTDNLYNTGVFTVETWIKRGSPTTWANIVHREETANSSKVLIRLDQPSGGTANQIAFQVRSSTGTVATVQGPAITDTNWHHIVATSDGTTLTLYVDGVSRGTGTFPGALNFQTVPVRIGAYGDGANNENFAGEIDEVGIYKSALSPSRVTAHYNSGMGFVDAGYTAQVMTASATTPDAVALTNVRTLSVTEDTYAQSASATTNFGNSDTLGYQYKFFKLPSTTVGASETISKALLRVVPNSASSGQTIYIYRIDADWGETTLTYNNRPAMTLIRSYTSAALSSGVPIDIDVTGAMGGFGVAIETGTKDVHSAESADTSLRPSVIYTISPVQNVSVTSDVMLASATLPDPVISNEDAILVDGQPLLASASMPNATVSTEQFIDLTVEADPIEASAEMPAGSGYRLDTEAIAEAFTASAEIVGGSVYTTSGVNHNATALTATARFIKPALVNGTPIVTDDASDRYFQLVWNDSPRIWWRLADQGSTAADRMGLSSGTYHGVQMGQFGGPDNRPSAHFNGNGAYISQDESGTEGEITQYSGNLLTTLEFSFKTTKTNQVLMAGADYISNTDFPASSASPAREVIMKDGKIGYRSYFFQNSLGQQPAPFEFTGFKNLADGQWHNVIITGGTIRNGETGVEIYVDGKLEVRRVAANTFSGFPDYVGGRPVGTFPNILGYDVGPMPSSQYFEGDMSEIAFYAHANVTNTEIARHYYAFMGWTPVEAQPMEVTATLADAFGQGNQKRALYLWWAPQTDAYNVGGDGFNNKMNFDPLLGYAKGRVNDVVDYEGYKVFVRSVLTGPNEAYRDLVTDEPSLIDLTRHVNLEDYDMIMFGDWPDEGDEIAYFDSIEPGGRERLAQQLLDANAEYGIGLMVTHPRLAVDLGIVDRVEFVPTLKENMFDSGQGAASGLYDYGSAYDFPWNITGDEGLTSATTNGSTFNGQPVNRNPAFLSTKAYFYGDTHKNDRFRVRALINGLTDLPSYMIDKAIYHAEYDFWGWDDVAYKYIHRLGGLQIGDEYIFHGTDKGMNLRAVSADYSDVRVGRWYGAYATPMNNVKAGVVVTTFGSSLWQGNVETDNPYKDYATTIALQPGTSLGGRVLKGKVFVNFTEQPNRHDNVVAVQKFPTNGNWPANYNPETPEQMTWDYSFTRKTLNSTQVQNSRSVTVTGPNGQPITVSFEGGSSASLAMTRSNNIFDVDYYPSFNMVPRGLRWLQETVEIEPGAVTVNAQPIEASGQMANPSVTAQHDVRFAAQAMVGNSTMPKVAEDETGDASIVVLPMAVEATFGGFNRVIRAEPMIATAEIVEPEEIYAAGEQIVLTLHGYDATLYLKEED